MESIHIYDVYIAVHMAYLVIANFPLEMYLKMCNRGSTSSNEDNIERNDII
jgi:hypothetical protein